MRLISAQQDINGELEQLKLAALQQRGDSTLAHPCSSRLRQHRRRRLASDSPSRICRHCDEQHLVPETLSQPSIKA